MAFIFFGPCTLVVGVSIEWFVENEDAGAGLIEFYPDEPAVEGVLLDEGLT